MGNKNNLTAAIKEHNKALKTSREAAKHLLKEVEKKLNEALKDTGLHVEEICYARANRHSSWQEVLVNLVFDDYGKKEAANAIL
ncbi:hypothetical protein [Treponema putidum]|uniref:hypothetical protein n=1 Tax=Treponema putidum TaxID=221027 RepID=UPI0021080737|nr:hypothetical protein [Treponema putidum]UTY31714.1 hypothetical protein E4N75_09645 [Treponema putidum]